jgi:hypothetical protein
MKTRSFFSRGISALLILSVLTIAVTTTQTQMAAAQPQGKGPCPPGFELNRGVCQAEPEYSCQFLLNQGFPPARITLTDDGQCQIRHGYGPDCFTAEDSIGYDIFDDRCETNGQLVEASLPEDLWCRGDDTVQRIDNVWQCVFYEFVPAQPEECDVGTLNDESGLCEIKPGNRSA